MSSQEETKLELRPTRRQKLAKTVTEDLLEEIRRQKLSPGTKMPSERQLMEAMGVGRSTIREALNALAMMGVLEIRHGRGAFVVVQPAHLHGQQELATALEKGVTRDLLEARRSVELDIVRLAAERRTDTDLEDMRESLDAYRAAVGDDDLGAEHAAEFHAKLVQAAHNEVLAGFIALILPLLVERGPKLEQIEGYIEWELADHQRLYDAVAAGDPDRAAAVMAEHLEQVMRYHATLDRDLAVAGGDSSRAAGSVPVETETLG